MVDIQCIYCGSTHIVKVGRIYGQRYRCESCHRGFGENTLRAGVPTNGTAHALRDCYCICLRNHIPFRRVRSGSKKTCVVTTRQEIAQVLYYKYPEIAVTTLGELLGLAPGSARLGKGVFGFKEEHSAQFRLPLNV